MAFVEKRGSGANLYYIARFSDGTGKWPTVKNSEGETIRFKRKRDAKKAGEDKEVEVRARRWTDPSSSTMAFGAWVNRWYAAQDLALSSMQTLRHHCEDHLLPEFENADLGDIDPGSVEKWVKKEREVGYKPSSIGKWRGTLHTILADAADPREVERILGHPHRKPQSRTHPVQPGDQATRARQARGP